MWSRGAARPTRRKKEINMNTSLSRALAVAVVGFGLLGSVSVPANAFNNQSKASVNLSDNGLALRGYDPVAYFTVAKPTPGVAEFKATHDGATYQFASAANRDAFLKEPAKFAPQYGGFCAYAAALNKKFDADPNVWKIVDNKLYVNFNADVGAKWNADVPGFIQKANVNWTSIKDKAPADIK
jgi:YHS domain-containing protein